MKRDTWIAFFVVLALALLITYALPAQESAPERSRAIGQGAASPAPSTEAAPLPNRTYVVIFGRGSNMYFSFIVEAPSIDEALHRWIEIREFPDAKSEKPIDYTVVQNN